MEIPSSSDSLSTGSDSPLLGLSFNRKFRPTTLARWIDAAFVSNAMMQKHRSRKPCYRSPRCIVALYAFAVNIVTIIKGP